ncbi:MBL fold metallo-hydrolase [Saccharopolyspora gloriosae]|uniref:MBL fold metallo-hydrolase n=1 Tax=Saccharopolyspora gloriosae TaxID=455344 RepID=UPI001FB6E767|nr:MBL fold metallo-hydrolase [Saccharopolyspora gloriosae]
MSGTAPEPKLVELADGVYAHTQPDGGWCLNNAGLIAGRDGVVVVDTAATERRALLLRKAVDALGTGGHHLVVNTHHHGDHVFGNYLFAPAAAVIAHERAREEIAETGMGLTLLWPEVEWGDIRLALPTVTFQDRMTLHVDDRIAELHHVGPAHTTNDVVVWLPAERILFAGDVLLNGCTPFNLMGSIEGSLLALERLRAFEARIVVGGHGEVCGPEVIDRTERYLRRVQQLAAAGFAAGRTPLQVARDADLGEHAELLDPERLVGNLHRAYAELEGGEPGRPLDVVAIFQEMIDFNGGELPTCLA